jgi:hypothetical protein
MRPFGPKELSLAQQQYWLSALYPESACKIMGNRLEWRGTVQPSEVSRSYVVRILYKPGTTPRVYVDAPSLRALADAGHSADRKLPHVYPEAGDPLCLFQGSGEWNSSKLIAKTTLPWTSLWLEFFELWVMTNTWEGSGA